jgi:transcription elongation factor Elf1
MSQSREINGSAREDTRPRRPARDSKELTGVAHQCPECGHKASSQEALDKHRSEQHGV